MLVARTDVIVCSCVDVRRVQCSCGGDTHHTDRASITTTSSWRKMNGMNAASFDSSIIIKYHWHYISCMHALLIAHYTLFTIYCFREKGKIRAKSVEANNSTKKKGKIPLTIINIQHG